MTIAASGAVSIECRRREAGQRSGVWLYPDNEIVDRGNAEARRVRQSFGGVGQGFGGQPVASRDRPQIDTHVAHQTLDDASAHPVFG